jgi:toxin ParE1/3/4
MLKILRLPLAEEDLINIWLYGYEQWGLKQADCYADSLDEQFKLLAASPEICRERAEFIPPVRIHRHGSHLIIYTANRAAIVIVRVLHYRMDLQRHI